MPIWKTSLHHLRQDWQQVFTTHLAYTVLGFVIFAPLFGLLGRLLLKLSDQPALADQDIAWFLLSPSGMVALVLLAAVLITIAGFEQATLMTLGASRVQGVHLGTVNALRFTAAYARFIFFFALRLVVRVLLLTLPFLAIAGGIAWLLLTDYDINYYLNEQPPIFWVAVISIGLLLLAMLALLVHKLIVWSLALPLVLFAGVSPAQSFAESERITRWRRREILTVLGLWALLAVLLSVVLLGIIQQLGAWVVPAFFDSIVLLVPVLGGFMALWVFGNFLITAFTSGSLAYLLVGCYEEYSQGTATPDLHALARRDAAQGWRLTKSRLALLMIGGIICAVLLGHWLLKGIQMQDAVTVVAHRGAAGAAPENTLAAVRRAVEDGTDWVEIDVQETVDGEVVVIHDSDFMKLAGNPLKVWDGTLAQVQGIDIGSWFSPAFSAERVPTLAAVLEEVRGKAGLVIELKYYGHDQQLEQRVVDIVEQTGMVDEVAIMSLKYDGIQKIRKLRPDWSIGLLSAKSIGNLARLDVDFLAVNTGMATPGFVRRAQENGKQVFVWTVNDRVSMFRMFSLGINGIITDEPAMAREVLEERVDLGIAERLLMHTAVLFGRPVPPGLYRDESP
ncbi:MAG TPA: glycerophosphodiester phosphodiesterase [Gammaproteobacteria bacterium]|nr:glycerophosphodiester phosphodiesterase [Gammaproteobacteria bacterium]